MALTLEDLEKRLAALEQEVAYLRSRLQGPPADETSAERGFRILREAKASDAASRAAAAKAFAEMGITGEPVGHEKLMQMMLEAGINPEDNEFSREIIAMREE
jgi:cell division septum initiation protein DivIVA